MAATQLSEVVAAVDMVVVGSLLERMLTAEQ